MRHVPKTAILFRTSRSKLVAICHRLLMKYTEKTEHEIQVFRRRHIPSNQSLQLASYCNILLEGSVMRPFLGNMIVFVHFIKSQSRALYLRLVFTFKPKTFGMKLKPNLVQYVIFSSAIKSAENIDKCYVIYGSYMITLWLFYDV